MRGATRITIQLHQILPLPRKIHLKRPLQCAEQQESSSNFTKYCTCHEKSPSWLILVTYETSFTRGGATRVTLQPHQILRLPRKSEFKIWAKNPWIASANIKTIRPWSEDNPKIKSSSLTRRFGDLTRPVLETHFVWKSTTFCAPAISQNFTKCCACHEKWHSNFTKYCACHEKALSWLIRVTYETSCTMRGATGVMSNITKYCTCHEKSLSWFILVTYMKCHLQCAEQQESPSNLTKSCACHENLSSRFERKILASANIKTMRPWSEDKISSPRTRHFGDLTRPVLETH